MKKILFLLMTLMVIGFIGCDRTTKADSGKSKVDVVILKDGQMQFYNQESQKLTPYEGEPDKVVNLVFDNDNHLYYTAAKQQDLLLKSLDLSVKEPQPKLCAHWQLTLDEITDMMYGTGPADINMDGTMKHIIMMNNDMGDDRTFDMEVCDIASGKTEGLEWYDYSKQYNIASSFSSDHFFNEKGNLYYVSPEGTVCLNDRFDFTKEFDEDEIEDLWFNAQNMSPDGKKVVYSAVVAIGEGWGKYCVATSDGKTQTVLSDSDVWDQAPQWLDDGSLVYAAHQGEEEACVKLIAPDGNTSVIATGAKQFFVNQKGRPAPINAEKQEALEGVDMAMFDQGKLVFFNASTNQLIPLTVEKDSVVDGVFCGEDAFYYTVVIGDELCLKRVYLAYSQPTAEMVTDWGLKLRDCFSEDCDVAPMKSYSNVPLIEMRSDLDEEYCEYIKECYYHIYEQTKYERWPDDINVGDAADNGELQLLNDQDWFKTEEVEDETASEDEEGYKTYYYYVPDLSGEPRICISDKIDFEKLGGYYQPSFQLYGINPTRNMVVYAALTDWGHVGHGPLCFATLDGKVQKIMVSDAVGAYWGWLNDGRLVYANEKGINVVSSDGTEKQISTANKLVTRQ